MRIWLIRIFEPLPTDGHASRLWRTGLLANKLVEQGHEVVWWASTFDHNRKQRRFERETSLQIHPRYRIQLLHSAIAYRRNVCLPRMINHWGLARAFARLASSETRPDIIFTSLPSIELSAAAVRYGQQTGVPVVIDVRDLWPDIFLDLLPSSLRRLGRLAVQPLARQTRAALQGATGIVGVSDAYLQWALRHAKRPPGCHDVVFPLGYEKPVFSPEELQIAASTLHCQGVDPSKLICWFIGTFGQTYDLATVIHAARELARRGNTKVQFVLSGDGDQHSQWVKLARDLPNVVFTGWINASQVAYMMTVTDVGLAAYAKGAPQGLPNKLFEYFAAGVPVLSSLQGEANSLLRSHQCGLTYVADDPASFLDALAALTEDNDQRGLMGANAERLYEERYTADAVYSRMEQFLTDVARRHGTDVPLPEPAASLLLTR